MVIGVDAGALSVTDDRLKVGVYRVTREALRELVRIDCENEYRLYGFGRGIGEIGEIGGERVKVVRLPKAGWSKVWLPLELKKHPVDVFLGFTQALPFSQTSYNIGFIYDLGFIYRPDVYGAAAVVLKKQTDRLVRRASHIVTVSHATKADIIREYGVPGEKISVAYPGVGPAFSPAGEKHEAPRPYVLFVGSLNKAKDIPTLIEVVGGTHYDLYLIGGEYWPDPAIEETIGRMRLGDRVKRLGFVTDSELPAYYRGATAFMTVALQEGFCLPAAEAMACGTPVVALDRGALKEVVGEGGIVLRTKKEFQDALVKMTDAKIRGTYFKKAIAQAKKFRWEEFARHVLQTY